MEPLEWCRQRLLVPGNPMTATLPFVSDQERDAILALRTAISEIAFAGSKTADAEPVRARLAWWRDALENGSSHPAVEALEMTGVRQRLDSGRFEPLLAAVVETTDNPRFETTEAAWGFFRRIGGSVGELEARLIEPEGNDYEPFVELGAAGYLVRVTRDLAMDAHANRWLVPLDLQADFQVARQDALSPRGSSGLNGLIRAFLSVGVKQAREAKRSIDPNRAWRHRHALLLWALERRLAAQIARRPGRILTQRLLPGQIGNSFAAWREARRLRRRAGTT
jgi:phytoene synthase